MPVRERAALGVLAGEANRDAVDEERRVCERLRLPPVDAALLDRLSPPLELLHQLRVRREPVGGAQQLLVQLAQPVGGDGGVDGGAGRARQPVLDRSDLGLDAEGSLQLLVRGLELRLHGADHRVRLLLGDDPFGDELRGVLLAHGRMRGDGGGEQRLRVRRLVLLVVPVPAVADEVDDDVVTEAPAVGEREPDGADRRLWIVGVDVDDRDVEALREVARVARRARVVGIGGEADLVVRDQMQRAARRVAGEALEVECLRHFALGAERGVAVQQDGQRDGRVVVAVSRRAVGLLCARASFHHRVDRLQVARVGSERDGDLAGLRRARALGAEVVLDVSGAALLARDDGVDRALALELAEDDVVGPPDDVREHVQAAAVCHADDDLVGAAAGGLLDRLVEHRHHHVQALDGELLLAEERAAKVLLHSLDAGEAREQGCALLVRERLPVATRLDRMPQPDALLVVGDVLDLVRDRPAVRLAQLRQRVGECLPQPVQPQDGRRDPRLQLRGQLGDEPLRLERRIARRLGPEGVEVRGEMAVHAEGLDERHRGGDAAHELLVGDDDLAHLRRRRCRCLDGSVAVAAAALQQAREPGLRRQQLRRRCLEEGAPLGRDGGRVVEVLLEQQGRVARVQPIHHVRCSSRPVSDTRSGV